MRRTSLRAVLQIVVCFGFVHMIPTAWTMEVVHDSFRSSGHNIRVERFETIKAIRSPAVVLLHGMEGLHINGKRDRYVAKRLAQKGSLTVLIHYFDRASMNIKTSTKFRDFVSNTKMGSVDPHAQQVFHSWVSVVADAVNYTRKHPGVDSDRIGLVGFSLGAFLATATSTQKCLRIRYTVELFGGFPMLLSNHVQLMPPTLIIHETKDTVVPPLYATNLHMLMKKYARISELKFYKGVGHGLVKLDGSINLVAAYDVDHQTSKVLTRHLDSKKQPQQFAQLTFAGL